MNLLNSIASLHILLLVPSILCTPCDFPAISSLGDSNSDTGGFSAAFGPLTSPFGETFFREPAGRFSDGRLIIVFIAESLGLPYLSSYLDSIGSNFSHGANFAKHHSLSRWLQSILSRHPSHAILTIQIQIQDNLQKRNKSADQYIPDAMKAFSNSIKSLYDEGGRYFWIHNTGPLGCLPYVLWQDPKKQQPPIELDSLGCAIVFNELAKKFNIMLNETVAQLRKDFPVAAFTYVDIYSAKYLLISQANKFGFKQPLMACCGHGGGLYNYDPKARCGTSIKKKGSQVLIGKSCMDSRKRVNWDGAHYTEAANKLVFDKIVTGDFSDPPNSLNMACFKHNTL